MHGTYYQRADFQKQAEQDRQAQAKKDRDAEILAWHLSFGSVPHDRREQLSANPANLAPADLSKRTDVQLIQAGLDSPSLREQHAAAVHAQEATTDQPPADWDNMSADALIHLGLKLESSRR